ncbi:hypothetical protein IWQ61_010631, partial [Dispira simplex]
MESFIQEIASSSSSVSHKNTLQIGTPGGMTEQVGDANREPLPYDVEEYQCFVDDFKRYARRNDMTEAMKICLVQKYLPKKLAKVVKTIAKDSSWRQIHEYLIEYGVMHAQDHQKRVRKHLRALGNTKVSERKLGGFLIEFQYYAKSCKDISDDGKKILLKALPKNVRGIAFKGIRFKSCTLTDLFTLLKQYAMEKEEQERFMDGSSESDTSDSETDDDSKAGNVAIVEQTQSGETQEFKKQMNELSQQVQLLLTLNREKSNRNLVRRCLYCDSTEHLRDRCSELQEALRSNKLKMKNGQLRFNHGTLIPPQFGHGGMKIFFKDAQESASSSCILTMPVVPKKLVEIPETQPLSLVTKRRKMNGKEPVKELDEKSQEETVELPRKSGESSGSKPEVLTVPDDAKKSVRLKYKLAAEIHDLDNDEVVMRHLNSKNLGISPYEYIAVVPRAQEILRKSIRRKRIYNLESSHVVAAEESDPTTGASVLSGKPDS